jgi:hypothetical protein
MKVLKTILGKALPKVWKTASHSRANGASRAALSGRVEALFTLICSQFDVISQRSSSANSSESLSFAKDVVLFSGFHFTFLYPRRPEPVNHLEASSPKRCRSSGIMFARKR